VNVFHIECCYPESLTVHPTEEVAPSYLSEQPICKIHPLPLKELPLESCYANAPVSIVDFNKLSISWPTARGSLRKDGGHRVLEAGLEAGIEYRPYRGESGCFTGSPWASAEQACRRAGVSPDPAYPDRS